MATTKKIGIWIDHSSAHLTEFTNDPMMTRIIESDFTYQDRQQTIARSENVMHNKEQHRHAEYYNKLGEAILDYEDVLLFGPTDAKAELYNILRADLRFAKINIKVKQSGKMTENQQHSFVRAYFA
jgi:hypothetical protein